MTTSIITSPVGVMTVLIAVVTFWFWLERSTRWKIFEFLPPLVFIYASPVLLSNSGVIPFESTAYDFLRHYGLPIFIVLMLIKVDVVSAVRIMGKGVFVMLLGSIGVVFGGVMAYKLGQVLSFGDYFPLAPDSWRAFGTLAGSWIGGTGNMTAAYAGLEGAPADLTMAAAADQMVYLIWLPILLGSKSFADRFNRWARVPHGRLEAMETAAANFKSTEHPPTMTSLLYLGLIAVGFTWISLALSEVLPPVAIGGATVITAGTWLILLVTTMALLASVTPARKLPAAQPIAMAIIYIYVARVGATMDLSVVDWDKMIGFIAMAYVWIMIHGMFILTGAWIFRVDIHTVAIASAANIGGAASAPIVAAHHRETLVPASILMALIGYAVGNYLAILTGRIGQLIGS
ncbi:MAG: DUF819 family protein [Xanthomonadales bacterium]|nr:DUF819 family protein [Xanthomonadales bacterium]